MLALGTVIPVLQYRPPLDIFLNVDDGFIIAGGRKNSIWDFFEKKSPSCTSPKKLYTNYAQQTCA